MPKPKALIAAAVVSLIAANAQAQAIAPPDPQLTLVPPADRLTVGDVFLHADPVMKVLMAGLALAALAGLALWITHAVRLRARNLAGVEGAIGFLSAVAAAGPLLGAFGAAYVGLAATLGLSNVRPTPSLGVVAPGLAEAALCLALGFLAAAIAVIGHRHLKGRLQGLAAEASSPLREPVASLRARLAG